MYCCTSRASATLFCCYLPIPFPLFLFNLCVVLPCLYEINLFEANTLTQSTISLLLNWGPIIFVPVIFLTTGIIESAHGARRAIVWVACLCFACTLIRAAPCLILPVEGAKAGSVGQFIALCCAHIAQILNAGAGPFVMSAPSKLSETW